MLSTKISIADELGIILDQMKKWAEPRGGSAQILEDEAQLYKALLDLKDYPRILILYSGEDPRGGFKQANTLDRVDRQFKVVVVRGKGFKATVDEGKGLINAIGAAVPFYDALEEIRDQIRIILNISEENPVDYKGIRPMPNIANVPPQKGAFLDAKMILFSTANDIPHVNFEMANTAGPTDAGDFGIDPGFTPPDDFTAPPTETQVQPGLDQLYTSLPDTRTPDGQGGAHCPTNAEDFDIVTLTGPEGGSAMVGVDVYGISEVCPITGGSQAGLSTSPFFKTGATFVTAGGYNQVTLEVSSPALVMQLNCDFTGAANINKLSDASNGYRITFPMDVGATLTLRQKSMDNSENCNNSDQADSGPTGILPNQGQYVAVIPASIVMN